IAPRRRRSEAASRRSVDGPSFSTTRWTPPTAPPPANDRSGATRFFLPTVIRSEPSAVIRHGSSQRTLSVSCVGVRRKYSRRVLPAKVSLGATWSGTGGLAPGPWLGGALALRVAAL